MDLTNILAKNKSGDCSGGMYTVLPKTEKEALSSGFKIQGFTELPCAYTNIEIDRRFSYVAILSFNWESDEELILVIVLILRNMVVV